jgi:hypothetical protein
VIKIFFLIFICIKNNELLLGRYKCNELNDFDEPTDGLFSLQSRRSYSRERLSNSFAKNSDINGNGYRSINNSQRRLHSVSSYSNDEQLSNTGFDRLEQDFVRKNFDFYFYFYFFLFSHH